MDPVEQLRVREELLGSAAVAAEQARGGGGMHGCPARRLPNPRLERGEAHVIRNAGGVVTDDEIRSLAISQRLLGTKEIILIHHTDCGMLTFNHRDLREKVKEDLGSDTGEFEFLPFRDLDESVREDVEFLQATQLLNPDTAIRGFVYDVRTGRLREVSVEATLGSEGAGGPA